ncbi:MAG: serine/threonine-protein phosphatase [Methyloprofundus sp.]|nr:serine/threonine-protein phosphatase [Methyloprofundus sp.]
MSNKLSTAPLHNIGISDKGNYKSLNEDAFKACPEMGLWVVADGMGGHEGGEIASQLAVEQITRAVKGGINLVNAIQQVHEDICQFAMTGNGKIGMATTVVAVQVIANEFEVAWVGDSRAYLFSQQQLTQLSRDHSVVQELIDKGEINERQARIHPQRHLVSQALGGHNAIRVDVASGLLNDSVLLLCSDGLSNELTDDKITAVLTESSCLKSKAEKLVASVLALEGVDNITVLLIQKVRKNITIRE